MAETTHVKEKNDALWVLAKIKNSVCALDGRQVESIQLLDQAIRPLPGSDDTHVGVLRYRGGSIIEVIDLRRMMGFPALAEEQRAFVQMLELRKQDHIHWVHTLSRAVEEHQPFLLATDPHKCAFGKWYDTYKADNQAVKFHLRKLDEPHQKLHATALEVLACKQEHSTCKRNECLKVSLSHAQDEYMPRIVSLLDDAKRVFEASFRKMAIVISNGLSTRAILVDEVLSAGSLDSMVENTGISGSMAADTSLISHIAKSSAMEQQILVLNSNRLFESEAAFA